MAVRAGCVLSPGGCVFRTATSSSIAGPHMPPPIAPRGRATSPRLRRGEEPPAATTARTDAPRRRVRSDVRVGEVPRRLLHSTQHLICGTPRNAALFVTLKYLQRHIKSVRGREKVIFSCTILYSTHTAGTLVLYRKSQITPVHSRRLTTQCASVRFEPSKPYCWGPPIIRVFYFFLKKNGGGGGYIYYIYRLTSDETPLVYSTVPLVQSSLYS